MPARDRCPAREQRAGQRFSGDGGVHAEQRVLNVVHHGGVVRPAGHQEAGVQPVSQRQTPVTDRALPWVVGAERLRDPDLAHDFVHAQRAHRGEPAEQWVGGDRDAEIANAQIVSRRL